MTEPAPEVIGNYALYGELASGGMATVHLGHLLGAPVFPGVVAIKRVLPQLASDENIIAMLLDEARVCSRIRHTNVVPILDVVSTGTEHLLVLQYVHGESLARLIRTHQPDPVPVPIAAAIATGLLHGLHAAHEARDERGQSLFVIHRDVSPQNVMVGVDGVPRVLDFGVAKAKGRMKETVDGSIKGKIAYMAPEQFHDVGQVDRRCDIFAASVVIWEMLTCQRLFGGGHEAVVLNRVLNEEAAPPSSLSRGIPPILDAIVLKGLAKDASHRFATAREMAEAIERSVPMATPQQVGAWVEANASDALTARGHRLHAIEVFATTSQASQPTLEQPSSRQGWGVVAVCAAGVALLCFYASRVHRNDEAPPPFDSSWGAEAADPTVPAPRVVERSPSAQPTPNRGPAPNPSPLPNPAAARRTRELLEPKVFAHKGSLEEIRLLKAACRAQRDAACVQRCELEEGMSNAAGKR
jgi:eukaryotic-like serine/threonine-protein kinase